MYHALFVLKPNVLLWFGFSCINISEPGRAIDVLLKWNSPSMVAYADRRGFCMYFLTTETMKSILGRRLHQHAMGKVGGRDAIVDLHMICKFAMLFHLDWFCASREGCTAAEYSGLKINLQHLLMFHYPSCVA